MKQKRPTPPRLADRLLACFCRADRLAEIQGDLHELYDRWIQQYGRRRAKALYFLNILSFFRLFALKRKGYVLPITSRAMLHNYFLTAWRQIQKSKLHTVINVFGLAIGIAACLVITLTIQHELSYDRHHPDSNQIYRVTTQLKFADRWSPIGSVATPVPHVIKDEITGLDAVAAFRSLFPTEVRIPNRPSIGEQEHLVLVEPDYFDVFSGFGWVMGSPKQSLTQPYQVVLTESQAKIYFGDQEAVGQTLTYFDSLDFVVSGILADDPHQTDLFFTDYLSFVTIQTNDGMAEKFGLENWYSIDDNSQAFVKLSEETSPSDISQQLPALVEKYVDSEEIGYKLGIQSLSKLHFNTEYRRDTQRIAHEDTLYGLGLVALFLLLIASINFINLETARAVLRSREVGVRKVLGSSQRQLIQQFLGETLLITVFAGGVSLLVAKFGVDYFVESLPPGLSLWALWEHDGWILLLAIIFMVSLLAGSYPAWVLSRYSPISALKNRTEKRSGASLPLLKHSFWVRWSWVTNYTTFSIRIWDLKEMQSCIFSPPTGRRIRLNGE